MLTAVAAVAVAWRLWPTVAPAPEVRLEMPTPESLAPLDFAVSPNGGSLVFAALDNGTTKLWPRHLNQSDAHPLKGTEFGHKPFWSPDRRSIGFVDMNTGRLKRVDLDGGVTTLTEGVALGARGSWNREGIILTPVSEGLARVPAHGGPLEMVVKARISADTNPVFLPDGLRFLCYLRGEKEGIYWGSRNGAPLTFLTAAESSGQVFQGRLFYINQGSLDARTLDLGRMELTGEPERIAEADGFSLSDSGFIASRLSGGGTLSQLRWWDRAGTRGDVGVGDLVHERSRSPSAQPLTGAGPVLSLV